MKFFVYMEIAYLPYGKIIYSYYLNNENEIFLDNYNGNSFFELEIDEPTAIDISIFSAKYRFNRNLFHSEINYNIFTISIYDFNNQSIKLDEEMIQELNLQKGKYIIRVEFQFYFSNPNIYIKRKFKNKFKR